MRPRINAAADCSIFIAKPPSDWLARVFPLAEGSRRDERYRKAGTEVSSELFQAAS